MPVSVDIVLPCYNPNERWHLELMKFHAVAKANYQINYIIVNDGTAIERISPQVDVLKRENIPHQLVSYEENRGKGFALRRGVAESRSDYAIYTDIDFPFTDESSLALIHKLVHEHSDVVAGFREQEYYDNKMSGFRKLLSKAFRFFIKSVLKMPITDTQCGLKGFNEKGKAHFLATKTDRYLFDFEFIYSVCRNKTLKIQAIPVQLKDNVVFSKMKLKILIQETMNLLSILLLKK
ncbi:MAG: glycosyltransferase [bacterium]|nr:glycosyltransferase [bacterium]